MSVSAANISRRSDFLLAIFLTHLYSYRESPDSFAGGGEDRIGDGRSHGWHAGFADPGGRCLARHNMHFDFRRLVYTQHRIVVKVALLHTAAIKSDLVLERS